MTVISYPIPAFQNLPIDADFYSPSRFTITNISLGFTTILTLAENVNYVVGQQVRLIIPPEYGSRELNEQTGFVLSIPMSNQVEVDIDTSQNVSPYISASSPSSPQILPVGTLLTGAINTAGEEDQQTFIPGSFINISPE